MELTFEQAKAITDRRDQAMMAGDVEAYMDLWADDLIDEGPQHCFEGKPPLRAAIEAALAAMKAVKMVTHSLAVQDDAIYYEFAIVWETRSTGERRLQTGMTYHQVDARGRLRVCREYWDPSDHPRRTAAERPEIAALLDR